MAMNQPAESLPRVSTPMRDSACSVKGMTMAISRPTKSENMPQRTRPAPLATRLQARAATRRGLRGDHEAADRGEHERNVQHPELRCGQHLSAIELLLIAPDAGRNHLPGSGRDLKVRAGIVQHLSCNDDDQALSDSCVEESRGVSGGGKNTGNERDEQSRTGAEAGGDQAGSGAAHIGEPLERRGDRAAIDERSAHAGQSVEDIKLGQSLGIAHAGPADADKNASSGQKKARAKTVNQPALYGRDPGFQENERRKGEPEVLETPVVCILQRAHK